MVKGCVWHGACMAGGVCGGGGACTVMGCAWQGACVVGGMHGRGHVWQGVMRGGGGGACVAGETATAADGSCLNFSFLFLLQLLDVFVKNVSSYFNSKPECLPITIMQLPYI